MIKKLLAGATLSVFMLGSQAAGLTEADLKWDLSYRAALRDHPISEREYMAFWPFQHPKRPIHEQLASYDGEPIEASVLLEKPDGHTGDPHASWFIKTRNSAKVCNSHPKAAKASCTELSPAKVEQFAREILAFRQLPDQASEQNTIGDNGQGQQILLNYMGYVSVYLNGKSLQRPMPLSEWLGVGNPQQRSGAEVGRMENAVARATLADAEFAARQARQDAEARAAAFADVVRRGDLRQMERLLDQAPDRGAALLAGGDVTPLALAAGNRQQGAAELLLRRGAAIDAASSAALRAAVKANDRAMMDFLLAKGARVDPPKNLQQSDERPDASALSVAVDTNNEPLSALLIRRGADVNLNLRESMLTVAARNLNYAMVDLLLKSGARPDSTGQARSSRTPLLAAVSYAQKFARWDNDPQSADKVARALQDIEQIARRLVAGGADINYLDSNCDTAYSVAADARQAGLARALVDMGGDAGIAQRCRGIERNGWRNSSGGAEMKARADIADQTRRLLTSGDYAGLERLYAKLNNDKVRTPSGIWGLAVFYNTMKAYPQRSRAPDYWAREQSRAAEWNKKFPKSAAAPMYSVYLDWNRMLAFRGNGAYAAIPKADLPPMEQAVKEGYALLENISKRKVDDVNWYTARLELLPYSELFRSHFRAAWQGAAVTHPDYHQQYFEASYFSLPKWDGAPDAVEEVARLASKGKGADRDAMYARVYWNLDQVEYHGKIFEESMADWNDMKVSFESLVRAYPDPWNLNAYAYFACMAKDYDTMSAVLKRVGEDVVFSVWGNGGAGTYRDCAQKVGTGTPTFATDLAARNRTAQEALFNRLISYATTRRRQLQPQESLRALEAAQKIELKLWQRNGVRTLSERGRVLMNLARYDDAAKSFRLALEAQPVYVAVNCQLGIAYDKLGRRNEARAQLEICAPPLRGDFSADLSGLGKEDRDDAESDIKAIRTALRGYGL